MADFEKIKKLRAIMELSEAEHACLKSLMHCNMDHVEKFIKANKLGIKLEDVAGYYDFAIFGAGKKAVILTCDYLYENKNGKSGIKIVFDDLKDVLIEKHDLVLSYKNGKSMRMFASIYAEYYYDIISKILELNRQEQDEVVTNKTESLEVKKVPEKIVDKQAEAERLEEENKAKAETEVVQSWDASAHLKLCQQYCTEMNAIPGIPVGCGRLLREDEICKIAKSCKNAKRLNLKFAKEINNKELEAYLNGRHVCHKDSVLAFVDHGKQGAVLILKDSYNGNSLIYNSEDGKLSMFTFDALDYSIHGAYMEHDQLVVWNERHIRENFQLGTLGLSIAELLQKLLIAFFGVKDYEKIEAERLQRIEYRYQEICRRKEEAEAKAKAEAEAKAKAEADAARLEEENRAKAEVEAEARERLLEMLVPDLRLRELVKAKNSQIALLEEAEAEDDYELGLLHLANAEECNDEKEREKGMYYLENSARLGNKKAAEMATKVKAEVEIKENIGSSIRAEAYYRLGQMDLKEAEETGNEARRVQGKRWLEMAANYGHEEAAVLLKIENEKDKAKAEVEVLEKKKTEELEDAVLEVDIVTLLINDEAIYCSVIGILSAANGREYIALLPNEGEDVDTGQVYLYRYIENDEGEVALENIDDDAEFEIATTALNKLLDDLE